jgi:hypothetical protein
MRCTILEPTKVSAMLMFVVKSPQIPGTPAGKVEFIYQNISAKNAFRIIAPCDLLGETLPQCHKARFWGDSEAATINTEVKTYLSAKWPSCIFGWLLNLLVVFSRAQGW